MSLRNLILAGLLAGVWPGTENVLAQLPEEATRIYTLTSGSELTDDCPICDRIPIVVPMTGTFRLRFLDQNPVLTRYQVQNISFHAGAKGGAEYWVSGSGTYQAGGEVAVFQDLFLDVQVDDGLTKTSALGVNGDRFVTQPWPEIQSTALQTNGTATKLYSLKLVAVPALQFRAIMPDRQTGNIRLQWDSNGGQAQLERARLVEGPYAPISPITTSETFTDMGALTNRALFYRLRQY
jgi:hypothetical protein